MLALCFAVDGEGVGGDLHQCGIVLEMGEVFGPGSLLFLEKGIEALPVAEAGPEGEAAKLVGLVGEEELFALGEFAKLVEEYSGLLPVVVQELGLGAIEEGSGDGFVAVELDADFGVACIAFASGVAIALKASVIAEVVEAAALQGAKAGLAAFSE